MLLGWRDVPTDNSSLGVTVKPTEPNHMQVFIARNGAAKTEDEFERSSTSCASRSRRRSTSAATAALSLLPVSISCNTVIYKGMFLADQLGKFRADVGRR